MNATEIRNSIANNNFFSFTAENDKAVILSDLINESGFSTISINNGNATTVIAIDNPLAKTILGRDIFPEVESAILTLSGNTNHDLNILLSEVDGEFHSHRQGMGMRIFGKVKKYLDKYGNLAFRHLLEEDLELNKKTMLVRWQEAIEQLLTGRYLLLA